EERVEELQRQFQEYQAKQAREAEERELSQLQRVREQRYNQFYSDVEQTIQDGGERYRLINARGLHRNVANLIEQIFQEQQILLDYDEAAQVYEEELRKE